jgi:Putative Actinobacterial Holin-X, holin superfamily III
MSLHDSAAPSLRAPAAAAPSSLDLLAKLLHEAAGLIRDEWMLARTELKERLAQLRAPLVLGALAAVCGLAAVGGVVAAAVLALALVLPAWAAALIVGLVLTVAAVVMGAGAAARLRRLELRPRETLRSLQEGKQWLKNLR